MSLSELLGADIESAKLEMGPDGNIRVLFDDAELGVINEWLKSELDTTYRDWVPIWLESVENLETYRCVQIKTPDGSQSVYPAPIARIPADQIMSSVYNAAMRSKPVFSIDSYLKATYSAPTPVPPPPQPGMPPAPPPPPQSLNTEAITSELCAHRFEQGYEFIIRERIQLPQKLMRGLRGAICGSPYWWKVVADPEQKTTMTPKVDGAFVDLNDKYEETRLRGDIVKWYLVPFTNCMMPIDSVIEEGGIDKADWFAERTAWRPDTIAKRFAIGDLFLLKAEDAASIIASKVDARDEFRTRAAQTTEKKTASVPTQECDTWLTWFYRDLLYTDPKDGQKKMKRLSLLGDFALTTGKLMTCWLNGYNHNSRPYELVDQMDEGDCTVGRMKYHQTMFTYGAQSEIQSAFTALNMLFWYDANDTDVADFFTKNKTIAFGTHIPGVKEKAWGTASAGDKHYSMVELLKLFLSMSQQDSKENNFTMGGQPPGRTPSATVSQVYQHAEETKTAFLGRLSNKLSRLLRLDMETRRQYQPLGEVLPVWDKEAKAAIEIPFRFPVGDVLDNFRIALTAADDAMKEEKDPQQIMQRKQALMQDGEYVAKVIGSIMNLQAPLPPEGVELFKQIIDRDQVEMRNMMATTHSDEEAFDLTAAVEKLILARNAKLEQMQSAPPQPPQPPPPKVVLSGKLTPQAESAAEQTAGIGAQNAQGAPQGQPSGAPPNAGQGSPPAGASGPTTQVNLHVHPSVPPPAVPGVGAGPHG